MPPSFSTGVSFLVRPPKSQPNHPRPPPCLRTGTDTSRSPISSFCSTSHFWICGTWVCFLLLLIRFFSSGAFYFKPEFLSVAIARTVHHAAGVRTHYTAVQSLRAEQPGVQLGHVVFLVFGLEGLLSVPINDDRVYCSTGWSRSFCLLDLSKGDWTSSYHPRPYP